MKPPIAAALFIGLILSGCTTNGDASPGPTVAGQTTYACEDGSTVVASYPTTETARIDHKGRTTEMAAAVSASGARYVGGG